MCKCKQNILYEYLVIMSKNNSVMIIAQELRVSPDDSSRTQFLIDGEVVAEFGNLLGFQRVREIKEKDTV